MSLGLVHMLYLPYNARTKVDVSLGLIQIRVVMFETCAKPVQTGMKCFQRPL